LPGASGTISTVNREHSSTSSTSAGGQHRSEASVTAVGLPIIVGGFHRSGTSLVRRLIDSHSNIHCGPEVKFFLDFDSAFPNDPLAHARLFTTAHSYGLTNDELLRIWGAAFVRFHELAAAKAGKARWADKVPENVLYLAAWQQLLPNGFAFVHVARHPLDALASLKEIGFARTMPKTIQERAELYRRYWRAAEEHVAANPTTSFTLSYEALVQAPETTLRELFTFLGENFQPTVLTEFHRAERVRGIEDPKVSRTRSVHAESVGRWMRGDLASDEVAVARDVLGDILAVYDASPMA
jgi:hypothetical protein